MHAGEVSFVLPFRLGHAGLAEPLARPSDLVRVRHLEPEVVGTRQLLRHWAVAQREQGAVRRAENQKVLVVMHRFCETEVPAVKRGRPFPIAYGQGDVIQQHPSIIAGLTGLPG